MSHQVLCEPSIVSSTKYCLCQCQVWSNKVSSINQVLCAHQAWSLPLPHHIIILSSIRYYLPTVWSGCQECDCYKCTCQGPNTLALGTSKRGGESVYNCYGDLDLRLENICRGIEAELSAPGIDTIQLFAWFNERLFFVEFVFQILNIRNLSRSGGRDVWIGANWDPGD